MFDTIRTGKAVAVGLLLVAGLLALAYSHAPPQAEVITSLLEDARGFHSISDYRYSPDATSMRLTPQADPHFLIPFERTVKKKKLRLSFYKIDRIRSIQVFFGKDKKGISAKRQTRLAVRKNQDRVYDFKLPDGDYNALRIDFDGPAKSGEVIIKDIELIAMPFYDGPLFKYLAALFIVFSLIIPGSLIYALFFKPANDVDLYQISIFSLSILFYLALYLLLLAVFALDLNNSTWPIPAAFFLLIVGPLFVQPIRAKLRLVAPLLKGSSKEFVFYTVIVLLSTFIVSYDTHLPVRNFHYKSISGPKTFSAFAAHDNYFQYVNGRAIAEDEPFEKYYADRRLFFYPQHREMLPGVVYAVYRKLFDVVSDEVGDSYLIYTIVGIAFNAMIVFSLAVFFRRYFTTSTTVLLLAVSLNAFVLVNYYFTWYKFAGAALFLSALLFLLREAEKTRSWATSGFLFGLSSSMHAGNALGIPLFYLWFTFKKFLHRTSLLRHWYLGPVALVLVFVLVNMPWSIVKRAYFEEDYELLKSFFIAGKSHPDGLLASVKLFFLQVPLQEQISGRLGNLYSTLHLDDMARMAEELAQLNMRGFLLRWNQLEFSRVAFVFYPSAVFLALSAFANYRFRRNHGMAYKYGIKHPEQLKRILLLGFAAILLVVILAFGRYAPDVNHAQPMGVILLVHATLVGFIFQAQKPLRILYSAYLLFVAARMAVFL